MALIDTFLKLMVEKRAERLVIVSDAVPYLLKAGEPIELSMPSLRADMVQRVWREMSGQEPGVEPSDLRREGTFHDAEGIGFGFHVHPSDADCRIEVHALGATPPSEPSGFDDALETAVAAFTRPPEPSPSEAPVHAPAARSPIDLLAIIDQAMSGETSDIFFSTGKPPRVRRNSAIVRLDVDAPTSAQILQLLPDEPAHRELERSGSADFAVRWELSSGSRRFRINVFRHLDGLAAALRPVRQRIPSLAELGLPESLLDLVNFPSGLVLITGTSGSGKSTTLAALIDHLNRTRARHIITLEDPVEFEHREVQCLIHQREVGANMESFSTGLHAALRENPDVILLGELRDLATISAALTAAETGHLVLATLHSGSASSAIGRIVDVFPGHQQAFIRIQLASSLRAVLSQRLVPTRSKGVIPAIEKLLVTPGIANGIREGHDHHIRNAMLTGSEEGMITLERSLASLVKKGTIDRETAVRYAVDQKALSHLLE
ncbi:MAG: hypothetical protein JWO82_2444 [Akkermansiaceae bacterium]|nr:hypothetical protein [Akkermansiaceae bacterium]